MLHTGRHLTDADGVLDGSRFLICDRDRKWSSAVRQLLETSSVRVIRTPFCAPNCKQSLRPASPAAVAVRKSISG